MTISSSDSVAERFAATLKKTLTMPAGQLRTYQNGLIARLLTFAFQNSAFYAARLKPVFRSGGEPDLRAWDEIPVLRRSDLTQQIDRINPERVPDDAGAISSRRTSGSTGQPMTFRTCWLAQVAAECMMHRHYQWHGIDIAEPMASIRYYSSGKRRCPDGLVEERWTMFGAGAPHHTLDVREPTECIVGWLERCGAKQLTTFPSLALDLCAQGFAPRISALNIGKIVGISETVTDHARMLIKDRLGWQIAQIYACAEMGCIALQSPVDSRYLICEETVLVEILDESDRPVPPGH
jgi:phenylacetate-CoA ligase